MQGNKSKEKSVPPTTPPSAAEEPIATVGMPLLVFSTKMFYTDMVVVDETPSADHVPLTSNEGEASTRPVAPVEAPGTHLLRTSR